MTRIACLIVCLSLGWSASAQSESKANSPIIDMHIHAYPADWVCQVLGKTATPTDCLPDPPNIVTGKRSGAKTDEQLMQAMIAAMKRYQIVKAVVSGPLNIVSMWKNADPNRVIGSPLFPIPKLAPYPKLNELQQGYASHQLGALGEVTAIYDGLSPSDPSLDPYYSLAEKMNIPVGIHTGIGIANATEGCCPGFRIRLADPLNVEEVLVRHPHLRLYIMHAGYPYLDDALALMNAYPQINADLAAIDWLVPKAEFQAYLERLVRAGMEKRLMFGTDEIVWPDAFGVAIDHIQSANFLTAEEKRDIFYNNAAKFLGLASASTSSVEGKARANFKSQDTKN
jgi:uncharacterized protein